MATAYVEILEGCEKAGVNVNNEKTKIYGIVS